MPDRPANAPRQGGRPSPAAVGCRQALSLATSARRARPHGLGKMHARRWPASGTVATLRRRPNRIGPGSWHPWNAMSSLGRSICFPAGHRGNGQNLGPGAKEGLASIHLNVPRRDSFAENIMLSLCHAGCASKARRHRIVFDIQHLASSAEGRATRRHFARQGVDFASLPGSP